jgi:hypothetical protein
MNCDISCTTGNYKNPMILMIKGQNMYVHCLESVLSMLSLNII